MITSNKSPALAGRKQADDLYIYPLTYLQTGQFASKLVGMRMSLFAACIPLSCGPKTRCRKSTRDCGKWRSQPRSSSNCLLQFYQFPTAELILKLGTNSLRTLGYFGVEISPDIDPIFCRRFGSGFSRVFARARYWPDISTNFTFHERCPPASLIKIHPRPIGQLPAGRFEFSDERGSRPIWWSFLAQEK